MSLLPSVLARKRLWNPKYPICIQLARGGTALREGGGSEENRGEEPGVEPATPGQTPSKPVRDPPAALFLFGRTGREKEEWFRHFLFASVDVKREKDRDRQRPGRCLSRPGRRDVNNALVVSKEKGKDKASL